ncbi:MAG: hypothetical protein P9M10_05230 [Candidatus Euphemobacter frigidus]|nr:hypothetical protein [Candidatus Euphemobacter frigidus]
MTAVIAEAPKTPRTWKVLRSAWIPAPPPESDPAIVSALGSSPLIEFESFLSFFVFVAWCPGG